MVATTKPPKKETLKETLKHVFDKDSYLITITYDAATNEYDRYDTWTDLSAENIYRMGFKDAVKFHENLRYTGVKTYIKLKNFNEAIPENKETSSTLADFWYSDATRDFQKGLTSIRLPTLDLKQIGMMIPVILGIILGLFFLFSK